MPRLSHAAARLIAISILALCAAACGGGGGASGGPNRAPVAAADAIRADGAALNSIDVLANDDDPDDDSLTVTIEEAPLVGTATVNANGTVRLADLPTDFKGLTQFKYRVADPDGESAVATAAVFVGSEPFRVIFAGDAAENGSPEIYLTDFLAPARAVSQATEGDIRLRGFVASPNGATIVYRRESTTTPAITDLAFATTGSGAQQVRIAFPDDALPLLDAQGNDQFSVSPNGQWIAAVAGGGNVSAVYILNIADPETVTQVSPVSAVHAELPRFSLNSQALYFLASDFSGGAKKSLYTIALDNPTTAAQISASIAPASTNDVREYAVASDQSRILIEAQRAGRVGLYFIDPAHLQTEIQVNHTLAPLETIVESTIGLAPGNGGSTLGAQVAYTTQSLQPLTSRAYVAKVSATPNPRAIPAFGLRAIGFRPDDDAVLYSNGEQLYEAAIEEDAIEFATADELIGAGSFGWYDSTGNIVLLKQFLPSGGSPLEYPALAVAVRGSFGSTQALGTPGLAAHFLDTTGIDRGVAIIGEGATIGAAPTSARLALVNAMAPEELLYLADFESPLQLTSGGAQVVTY